MHRSLELAAAAACAIAAGEAALAKLPPASPQEVVSATRSCMAALFVDGVDEKRLVSDGWKAGTFSKDGKAIATPLTGYARGDGVLLRLLDGTSGPTGCTLTAAIRSGGEWPKLTKAFSSSFGGNPTQAKAGEVLWRADGKIVQLATSGQRTTPSVRVLVVPVPGRKE